MHSVPGLTVTDMQQPQYTKILLYNVQVKDQSYTLTFLYLCG